MTSKSANHIRTVVTALTRRYRLTAHTSQDLSQHIHKHIHQLTVMGETRIAEPAFLNTAINNAARDFLRNHFRNQNRTKPIQWAEPIAVEEPNCDARIEARQLVDRLPNLERRVITVYFGLCGERELGSVEKVARHLGIGRNRTRLAYKHALARMQGLGATNSDEAPETNSGQIKNPTCTVGSGDRNQSVRQ